MSNNPELADIDIEYLHEHSIEEITPDIEDAFIELVGKNVNDGMSNNEARDKAFKCIFGR